MAFFNAKDHGLDPKQKPIMRLTNQYVIGKYAPYWDDIGQILGVENLNVIRLNNTGNPLLNEVCFKDTLKRWLQIDVKASWKKLQNAINQAIRNVHGSMPEDKTDTSKSDNDALKQSTSKEQAGETIDIDPEGKPPSSRAKEGQTKDDDDEDGAKSTNNVKPAKPGVGERLTRSVAYPPAKVDESCNMKEYIISKEKPAFAIIFDNEKVHGKDFRTGTEEDQRNICSFMEEFKEVIDFHKPIVKNLTKKEMIGAFKMLGKQNPSLLDNDEEINGAIKLFHEPEDCDDYIKLREKAKKGILNNCKVDFSKYSCFMAFIMSHGNENGICGADGKQLKVDDLSCYLTPKECRALENMPKIFFLQYCRGREMDLLMDDDFEVIKDDKTPNTADFLYVYATPENHKAMRLTTGTLFIQTLVEVMKKTLYHYHFEEVLFFVKNEMGRTTVKYDRESGTDQKEVLNRKQILSVVSQMRGRIFFVKD